MRYCLHMLVLFSLLLSFAQAEKPITIAIVDTGYRFKKDTEEVNLCQFGHKDFVEGALKSSLNNMSTMDGVPDDIHGHGTNIAYLINNELKDLPRTSYCLVIIRYYDAAVTNNFQPYFMALQYATNIKASVMNLSLSGTEAEEHECKTLKSYLDGHGTVLAAAGNNSKRLVIDEPVETDKEIRSYPATCDPRINVVGATQGGEGRLQSSNYGSRINMWENGYKITAGGITMSGTSQATATATGKLVRSMILGKNTK